VGHPSLVQLQAVMDLEASTPGDQVVDQDDDRYDEQNVDEAAADMEREAEEPKNDENDNNCPKHDWSFASRVPGSRVAFRAVSNGLQAFLVGGDGLGLSIPDRVEKCVG